MRTDYVVFILTHGRPDRVLTFNALRSCGYTGKIYLVLDDDDASIPQYIEKFGEDSILTFNKDAAAKTFDAMDNFNRRNGIVFARNISFEIARKLGVENFIQLDDDYPAFCWRFGGGKYLPHTPRIKNLDAVFSAFLLFYLSTPALTVAMSQGGDFIGGHAGHYGKAAQLFRKAMNSFFCSTQRQFKFFGFINEDVNAYVGLGSLGNLFLSVNITSVSHNPTQSAAGGMTDLYFALGTYVKSFYTVMRNPSSVKIALMQAKHPRIYHHISWRHTVPLIVSEDLRGK